MNPKQLGQQRDSEKLGQLRNSDSRAIRTSVRSPLCSTARHQITAGSAVRREEGTKSLLVPLCGAAVLRVTAGSAVLSSRAPSHGWLRCAAQQRSDSLLAPLCGAAGLRVTAGSAVQRSRAPSHGWLRCAAQQRLESLVPVKICSRARVSWLR